MTKTIKMTKIFREDPERATQETCDLWDIWSEWWGDMCWQFWQFLHCWTILTMTMIILWDIDYNSDNWKPDFMAIFVTWQLRVTLDSICNSCDVYLEVLTRIGCKFKPVLPDPWHFIQCVMPYGSNQGKNRLCGPGPLARWRRTCLCDVTCEHARKSVWSSICYIPLRSDNIKRFSQLGVPSELSSWFGWILGFLLHSRLDFVAQSFQFSSLSLPTLSSEPGQIILVGLGGTGFLLSCQSDFICFGPLQSFLDPLVFQGEREREAG